MQKVVIQQCSSVVLYPALFTNCFRKVSIFTNSEKSEFLAFQFFASHRFYVFFSRFSRQFEIEFAIFMTYFKLSWDAVFSSKKKLKWKMSKTHPPELKKYMDKEMELRLNGNRRVSGVLRGFDPFMNMVIDVSSVVRFKFRF